MSAQPEISPRKWLALYTVPRHEKQVSRQLDQRDLESFLPLCETVRRWKTGPTRVSLPFFPGYVFARLDSDERRKVLQLPGVIYIVGNRQGPCAMGDNEIESLRKAVSKGIAEPHRYLTIGSRVRVTRGPLDGMEGILVRKKGCIKVVVSIELIRQAVAVEIGACDLEPISNSNQSLLAA